MTVAEALSRYVLPRLEARLLLIHVLPAMTHAKIVAYPQMELTAAQQAVFCQLAQQRLAGVPMAYLLGKREFYGRMFVVNPAVLIPRPETEHLVEAALARGPYRARVLDLGTGSGVIAVTLALEQATWELTAVDLFAEAVAVAQHNTAALGAAVRFYHGSWYEPLPHGQRFDLIVSNPPYIARGDPHLSQADLAFEPLSALSAGADGLSAVRTITATATDWLAAGGWLLVEHGHEQGSATRQLFDRAGLVAVETLLDLAGCERVTVGRFC